jgi:hypothetical protein
MYLQGLSSFLGEMKLRFRSTLGTILFKEIQIQGGSFLGPPTRRNRYPTGDGRIVAQRVGQLNDFHIAKGDASSLGCRHGRDFGTTTKFGPTQEGRRNLASCKK